MQDFKRCIILSSLPWKVSRVPKPDFQKANLEGKCAPSVIFRMCSLLIPLLSIIHSTPQRHHCLRHRACYVARGEFLPPGHLFHHNRIYHDTFKSVQTKLFVAQNHVGASVPVSLQFWGCLCRISTAGFTFPSSLTRHHPFTTGQGISGSFLHIFQNAHW